MFHDGHALGENKRDDEVDERDDGVCFEVQVGLGRKAAAALHQVGHGHDGNEGRILEHGDAFIADRRKNGAPGLGKDDVEHGLETVEAKGTRSFGLSFGDGHDAGAEDLTHIGAVAEADGHDGARQAGNLKEFGEGVINVENLYQKRNAADDFHVGGRSEIDDWVSCHSSESGDQPQGDGTADGQGRNLKGHAYAVRKELEHVKIWIRPDRAQGDERDNGAHK